MNDKIRILDPSAIEARLKRMAYEIYEANYGESELIIIGIDERGGYLAGSLTQILEEISPLNLTLVDAHLDREHPESMGIEISIDIEELTHKPVVVVDDVLYSGNTLLNVVSILLQAGPKTLRTAVLIDRGHRTMPVSADFVGMELATTIQQHVSFEISLDQTNAQAFLL